MRSLLLCVRLCRILQIFCTTFSIGIGPSEIPNSGRGAFLTYYGARRLKNPQLAQVTSRILADSRVYIPETREVLQAVMPNGRCVSVSLMGENLHGNHNCMYWPLTAREVRNEGLSKTLQARISKEDRDNSLLFTKPTETVQLVGEGMQSHVELESRPADGIGFLKLYNESDYEPVSGVRFGLNLSIDLGVYGPLSRAGEHDVLVWCSPCNRVV